MKKIIYKLKGKLPYLEKYVVHNIPSNSTKTLYCSSLATKSFTTTANRVESTKTATAQAIVHINNELTNQIKARSFKNGDVLSNAQVAGFIGMKKTSDIVPLHANNSLNGIDVKVELNEEKLQILITATVKSNSEHGVEVEAITGASVAALTVYDMCKNTNDDIVISDIHLVKNTNKNNIIVKNLNLKPIKTTEAVALGCF